MKLRLTLFIVFCLLTIPVLPQNEINNNSAFLKKNSINVEIGGYTGVGAIFYERVIFNSQNFKTTAQIGYGLGGIPVIIHELISFSNNHLEFGLGILFPELPTLNINDNSKPFMTGRLGYRYQKPDGSFIFRIGLLPIISDDDYGFYINNTRILLWPGISFGYTF